MLLASTSEVYGDPEEHPQNESYKGSVNTVGIRSCYDEGKRVAETLCADYKRVHGLDIRIMRIFNTYGPNMRFDDGRVISNFIYQALKDQKITLYGDGSQTRSFCYVDDLIEGMILLMDSNYKDPMNIGNPNEFSIKELANLIRSLINPHLEFEYKELPKDDPKQRKPSINLAKEVLNWEPKTELKDGLLKTIDWFKKNI
jgi:UDP-glucuronate decarboxylase